MRRPWTLLSTHGLVLRTVARRPDARLRDVAAEVGLTERSVQTLLSDLVEAGLIRRVREGRRNRYVVVHGGDARDEVDPELLGVLGRRRQDAACEAVVLGCSDYRAQAGLLRMLASEDLVGRSELVLWPGGGPALAGRDRDRLFDELAALVSRRSPARLLLVSHTGCAVPEVPRVAGATIFETYRAVRRWARRIVGESRTRLGMAPELWLIDRGRVGLVPGGARSAARAAWREAR